MRDTHHVRATGLEGDTPIEIIDIIDDDADAFGDGVQSTTMFDSGGPRWVGPVAAAALVALIGYGVASSASTSSVPRVEPGPSTTTPSPTTTRAATPTTIPEPPVPYYAAEPSREYSVEYADVQQADQNYYGPGNYQLWSTPGATATSGSWFSVESYPGNGANVYSTDAYRLQVEQQTIAISHTPGGPTLAQFTPNKTSTVALTAFGLTDQDVVRLAQTVRIAREIVQFSDRAVVEGYELISTVQPWGAVQGTPVEQVFYSDGNNPVNGFGIAVGLFPQSTEDGTIPDRDTALRFFLDHATPFEVDGHTGMAGAVVGQQDFAMATWVAGDHIVTVSGSLPVPQLIATARTVHQVSRDEWSGMQFQASRHNVDNNFGNYEQSELVPVSFGTDATGKVWTIKVAIATFDEQNQVSWEWGNGGFGGLVADVAKISTVVDSQRTYVLAELPRAVAPTAQLQILRDGLDPVTVPFTDTDASFDRTFAAYAFSEPTTYTVQIIGADGAVLANWPS
ncbi:MAG: hypothetical protein QOJ08_2515 [Ilumatobacteraceae bacterium]